MDKRISAVEVRESYALEERREIMDNADASPVLAGLAPGDRVPGGLPSTARETLLDWLDGLEERDAPGAPPATVGTDAEPSHAAAALP